MADELGWVIETASGLYWNGKSVGVRCSDAFVNSADEAVRFARLQDAEVVRCWLFGQPGEGVGWSLRSAQHKWIDGHAQR